MTIMNADLYREAHANNLFAGETWRKHFDHLTKCVPTLYSDEILDFGCGPKGGLAAVLPRVTSHDPYVEQYSDPACLYADLAYDGIASLDVLEHLTLPEIGRFFDLVKYQLPRWVYLVISTRLAAKTLPDGSNAHATVRPAGWWQSQIFDELPGYQIVEERLNATDWAEVTFLLRRLPLTGVIPARLASTRLPGKLLLSDTGKPLLQHTWENAKRSRLISHWIIATDSPEIEEAAKLFEAPTYRTGDEHPNGTSRIAEIARATGDPLFVNVQGDEPELDPLLIDSVCRHLLTEKNPTVVTAAYSENKLPSGTVLVVTDDYDRALYFSRAALPGGQQHVGLYGYSLEALLAYGNERASDLEMNENLEQMRFLNMGIPIEVLSFDGSTVTPVSAGINTQEDYLAFVERTHEKHPLPAGG